MKTIKEIVHFYNDHQVYITTENQPVFTFSDLKNQIDWTKNFLHNHNLQKNDTIAIVLDNGPEMATSFLSVACFCRSAPLNPSFTASEFDYYLEDLKPKALIVMEDSNSPVILVAKRSQII